MRLRSLAGAAAALLLTFCLGAIRGPGKYSGVIVFDRWGGCTLCRGPWINYVAEAVKKSLSRYDGKQVVLGATKTHQPFNPGEARIEAFEVLAPAGEGEAGQIPAAPLRLSVRAEFDDGQQPAFAITARNVSAAPVTLKYESLGPVVLMKRPPGKQWFSAADGPSVAVLADGRFWGLDPDGGKPLMRSRGTRSSVDYEWQVANPAPLPRTTELAPGDEATVLLLLTLPAGEYDLLAAYSDHEPASWSAASNLVGFDVAAGGGAARAKVPGR